MDWNLRHGTLLGGLESQAWNSVSHSETKTSNILKQTSSSLLIIFFFFFFQETTAH